MATNMRRDPFQIAQRKQAIRNGDIAGSIGDNAEDMKMLPQNNQESPRNNDNISLSFSLAKPQMPNEIVDQQQRIPQLMQQLGLNNDTGSMGKIEPDALGQAKLVTLLRQKFGPDFMKDPRITQLLGMFADQIKSNPNDASKQLQTSIAGGNRILDLLKNGLTGGNT